VVAVRRRTSPLAVVAALVLGALASTTPAAAQAPPEPDVTTQIVGGSTAGADQFPWNAGVILRGASRTSGFRCGATVLSRSWAMTGAHCVLDYQDQYPDSTYGDYVAPSFLDVLTGTNTLAGSGGQRLQVAGIHPHPSYDPYDNDFDVALLRLRRPTSAPEIAVIGSSAAEQALDDPGVTATVSGWGVTSSGSSTPSTLLRFVQVPVLSASTCASSYPPGFRDGQSLLEYHHDNMLCAGALSGGKDSCQGDSGGPLAVQAGDGSWRQIGVTSFGYRCAQAGYPGVYHRLTSTTSWIGRTRRFGPFAPDATAYVQQQFRDFAGRLPSSSELATWRSVLDRSPAADLITWMQAAPAWDGNAGMNARLYRAAFGRDPDTSGFDYWVRQRWAGRGPVSIANHFAVSSEFVRAYGSLDDDGYVVRIYQNVFDRDPDPSGRAYWNRKLAAGTGRGQVLYELSNSSEYRRKTDTDVRVITARFGLLRAVPTPSELSASAALSQRSLIDTLRTSYRYASRFTG
jgi:secreted trypsin-like serine protease